jgi:amino acid transporter
MLFYLLLNGIFVLLPPFAAVAGEEDVAAVAARAVGGEPMAAAVRAVVALALFTSISAMVMVGPRVYARMADDGLMPAAMRFRGETPTTAVLAQAALAIVVVWIAGLRELLSYLGFTLGLSTAATVAALFVVVRRSPRSVRGCPATPGRLQYSSSARSRSPRSGPPATPGRWPRRPRRSAQVCCFMVLRAAFGSALRRAREAQP